MNIAERTMPVINVVYEDVLHRWIVALPGGIKMPAKSVADAQAIIVKHAPGSSPRFYRVAGPTEAEEREAWGK